MSEWQVLDNPIVWNTMRGGLNLAFGLYKKRIRVMQDWGILESRPSIIDIGCGIGQYAGVTEGDYLGVDLNERYIKYAQSSNRRQNASFRCVDVADLVAEGQKFDLVMMIDFLHHISDDQVVLLLKTAGQIANKYVVNFEPITDQVNPVGTWLVRHDRGKYMRPSASLDELFAAAGYELVKNQHMRLGPLTAKAVLASPMGPR
jgi:2-polyprenyl-3-methyl-5-hydroxy-6-metoxy-1,4-benzoquinol methylase